MDNTTDYYEILGVARTATSDEIKRAYKKLARTYHPDVNSEPDAEERLKEINEAYQVLSDDTRRRRYDQFGHAGVNGAGGGGDPIGFGGAGASPFGDLFESFFGGMGGATSGRRPTPRGNDLTVSVNLTFEESIFGATKKVDVDRLETCEACHGTRMEGGAKAPTCSTCGGTGEVRRVQQTILGQFMTSGPCPQCNGEGVTVTDPCHACKGKGRTRQYRTLELDIPAGIEDGGVLRLTGQGEDAPAGGITGDLYATVRVQHHKYFERKGKQITSTVGINIAQAALGDEIEIDTVDGPIAFKIPSGTQSGQQFRLREKGVPDLRGGERGDQLVTVEVMIPKKLTHKQRELFEELSASLGKDVTPQPKGKGFFDRVKDAMGV